jgi:dienelactone hydrolase
MNQQTLAYQADGLEMRGQLFFEPAAATRAAVLVFPEAFGLGENALRHAKQLAEAGYVALACDLHGDGRFIDDLPEALALVQPLFDDPKRTRARAVAAMEALAARPEVDPSRMAAIGFCFNMSLELARSGADLKAAVGFHTCLGTKAQPIEPGTIKGRVLVCIGADDPIISVEQRADFEAEMRRVKADWSMEIYGGTVHSFTSPDADRRGMPDTIRYSPVAAARSRASMLALFSTTLAERTDAAGPGTVGSDRSASIR